MKKQLYKAFNEEMEQIFAKGTSYEPTEILFKDISESNCLNMSHTRKEKSSVFYLYNEVTQQFNILFEIDFVKALKTTSQIVTVEKAIEAVEAALNVFDNATSVSISFFNSEGANTAKSMDELNPELRPYIIQKLHNLFEENLFFPTKMKESFQFSKLLTKPTISYMFEDAVTKKISKEFGSIDFEKNKCGTFYRFSYRNCWVLMRVKDNGQIVVKVVYSEKYVQETKEETIYSIPVCDFSEVLDTIINKFEYCKKTDKFYEENGVL